MRVVLCQERLLGLVGAVDEVEGPLQQVVLNRLHPLAGQRAGVGDGLLADLPEPRVLGGVVDVGGLALQHTSRHEELLEDRQVLRVVGLLRLLLGVQVVEVAVELVEPVDRGQELVAIAQVVLA